jgi:hypothetical protein
MPDSTQTNQSGISSRVLGPFLAPSEITPGRAGGFIV